MKNLVRVMALFLTVLIWFPAAAQEKSWNLGAKGGLMFPGTISVEGNEGDTEMGFMVGSYVDALVVPKLSIGLYGDFFYTTIEYAEIYAMIFSVGATIKGRFKIGDVFELRPGVAFGYNYSTWEDADESIDGFNVAGMVEAAIPVSDNMNALVEISFISQPAGGNEYADVTWSPIFFLALGIEYTD